MNAVVEAIGLVRAAAGPPAGYESVKAGIRRAARAVGIETGLAKRLWYGEVRRIDAELMDRLRRAADARARKEASCEYGTLLARIAACEAALRLPEPNLDRPDDHELRGLARGADRALDQGR